MKNLSQVGEFGFIDQIRKMFPVHGDVIKSIGDDTAVLLYTKDKYQLFTTDILIEDVHFARDIHPRWIGHKALACSISDVAAMGGIPKYAVISLGVPSNIPMKFLQQMYLGIKKLSKQFNVQIVGGDTVKSEKIIINIALIGEVYKNKLVARDGAKIKDKIFVTGKLGGSLPTHHHYLFVPRLKEAQYLIEHFQPHSMIDCSDGLSSDLGHILEESKVGARLYEEKVPVTNGYRLSNALNDGEDFELIFTVSEKDAQLINKNKKFKVFEIGEIIQSGFESVSNTGKAQKINTQGYKHF